MHIDLFIQLYTCTFQLHHKAYTEYDIFFLSESFCIAFTWNNIVFTLIKIK